MRAYKQSVRARVRAFKQSVRARVRAILPGLRQLSPAPRGCAARSQARELARQSLLLPRARSAAAARAAATQDLERSRRRRTPLCGQTAQARLRRVVGMTARASELHAGITAAGDQRATDKRRTISRRVLRRSASAHRRQKRTTNTTCPATNPRVRPTRMATARYVSGEKVCPRPSKVKKDLYLSR